MAENLHDTSIPDLVNSHATQDDEFRFLCAMVLSKVRSHLSDRFSCYLSIQGISFLLLTQKLIND